MIQKSHKNIWGIILVSLALLSIVFVNVEAAENSDACSPESLKEKYDDGIKIDISGYKLTIHANKLKKEYDGIKFILYKVNNREVSRLEIVSKKTENATEIANISKSIDLSGFDLNKGVATLYFIVENDVAKNGKDCSNKEFSITIEGVGRSADTVPGPTGNYTSDTVQTNKIDCSNPNNGAFEKAFCNTANKAGWKSTDDVNLLNKPFKCDYKNVYSSDQLKGECYYKEENTKYLYKKETKNISTGFNYKYHYSPTETQTGDEIKCKRTCEEALEVKYGPPVASKAGMCFEYKVKVISRVSCYSEGEIQKPDEKDVCTPYPICRNGNWSGQQGGPNKAFDSCVNSCDGGKYTKACSKKCYNKVYGKSNKTSNSSTTNYAKKLSDSSDLEKCANNNNSCNGSNCYGCYYRDNGSIRWYSLNNEAAKNIVLNGYLSLNSSPGRWYYLSNAWGGISSVYHVYENGIYRAPDCTDDCSWEGCGSNTYLNMYNKQQDINYNEDIYKKAVAKCKAKATCSESTAEFTIEADYKDGSNTKHTIKFPYESEPDKIKPKGKKLEINTRENKDTTTLIYDGFDCSTGKCEAKSCETRKPNSDKSCKNDGTCDLYESCYDDPINETDRYRATWSFPGSWINLKTGEVSYKKPSNESAWFNESNKFCIPLDAQDVNKTWWNYYYGKITERNRSDLSTSQPNSQCSAEFNDGSDIDIDWNIRAQTEGFGYFDWKIGVQCFYALNSKSGSCNGSNCIDKCEVSLDNYRIRSIDTEKMFPAATGEGERTPGFNWSSYADTTEKNKDYSSNPQKLIEKIQSSNTYSKEQLDYEIVLSKDKINKLKAAAKNKNYTKFDGDVSVSENGVSRYYSDAIRDEKNVSHFDGPTKLHGLNCNNMIKIGERRECEDGD